MNARRVAGTAEAEVPPQRSGTDNLDFDPIEGHGPTVTMGCERPGCEHTGHQKDYWILVGRPSGGKPPLKQIARPQFAQGEDGKGTRIQKTPLTRSGE